MVYQFYPLPLKRSWGSSSEGRLATGQNLVIKSKRGFQMFKAEMREMSEKKTRFYEEALQIRILDTIPEHTYKMKSHF
jgi:hypothetical protein